MQQDVDVTVVPEVKDAVVAGAQFPDVLVNRLRDGSRQLGAVLCQKLNVKGQLVVLDVGILAGRAFLA